MDKIIINSAHFLCNIGVTEEERKNKQEIIIDLKLFFDSLNAIQSDNIKNTINYSEIYELIKKIAEEKQYNLIEAMAENVAEEIFSNFNVNKVVVRIKKPNALADRNVKYVAVEISRSKNFSTLS